MVFCNVTILLKSLILTRHNPYFNRWFSAIYDYWILQYSIKNVTILILIDGFLQYGMRKTIIKNVMSHNPYFNRWFSAININGFFELLSVWSQSLF